MDVIRATYRLDVEAAAAGARAEAILLEQTVELPRAAVRDPFVEQQILGRVEEIAPHPSGGSLATIAFPVSTSALDPAQLLNLLFGNCSLQADVALADVELPPALLEVLRGPRFGVAGIRKVLGVYERPLTCTALKPMGLSPAALGGLCRTFARAGIDVIKDDHGLADHDFCRFEDRVRACQAAVEQVAEEVGQRSMYVPNLTGAPQALAAQLRFAEDCGVRGVMVAPMLVGLPAFWELCRERASVPVLAHPAFAGALRIEPAVLLGTIFRAFGADAVIYPHWGGRFSYGPELCRSLAERLRRPWGALEPALPVPAGGMSVERTAEVIEFYGRDAMLLIGGSLYEAGDALYERSRVFAEGVRRFAAEPSGDRS